MEGGNRLDAFQVIIFLSQLLLYTQRQLRSTCGMGPEINFSRIQPALTSIICISPVRSVPVLNSSASKCAF